MKMTTEHYQYLQQAIEPKMHEYPKHAYVNDKTDVEGHAYTAKRYRWDLVHVARLTPWICDNLYGYLNDSHIDTALRRITNTN